MSSGRLFAALALLRALASPSAAFAADTPRPQPAMILLRTVCVPVMTGAAPERTATRAARLFRIHPIWFPQSPPRGLRQYSGPYPVSINLTDDTCIIETRKGDAAAAHQDFEGFVSSAGWTFKPTHLSNREIYCDPSGEVAATFWNAEPGGPYDLIVSRRGECAASP